MDYLAREGAPIAPALWEKIDAAVIDNAKKHMVARRFLSLYGPLGPGASVVAVDSAAKDEALENGVGRITGRRLVELPQLYEDFSLLWRDLEEAQRMGYPVDLSAPAAAAQRAAVPPRAHRGDDRPHGRRGKRAISPNGNRGGGLHRQAASSAA